MRQKQPCNLYSNLYESGLKVKGQSGVDGNRTHQEPRKRPLNGFEDRGAHQVLGHSHVQREQQSGSLSSEVRYRLPPRVITSGRIWIPLASRHRSSDCLPSSRCGDYCRSIAPHVKASVDAMQSPHRRSSAEPYVSAGRTCAHPYAADAPSTRTSPLERFQLTCNGTERASGRLGRWPALPVPGSRIPRPTPRT